MRAPFQAEMLSVWLTRAFTVDLVEHLARVRGGARAVALAPDLRRMLGVGNSTGLGMAPFLVRHPVLLNNWMMAREEALARVRAQGVATPESLAGFEAALTAAQENAADWQSGHALQQARLAELRAGLAEVVTYVRGDWDRGGGHPWDALWRWGEARLPLEAQEALAAAMIEPHGDLVDGLGDCMQADEALAFGIDGAMSVGDVRTLLTERYGWALGLDHDTPEGCARFWYVSEEKLEPRLGERAAEPGAERELPLDISRQAVALARVLKEWSEETPVARLLLAAPEHRHMLRRVQVAAERPFAEVRDNLIAADVLPVDMLRCKLAFFGATRFDPRSDRWVRISLFQGAPYPQDLGQEALL